MRIINPPPAMRLGSTVSGRMKLASAPAIEIPTSAIVRADGRASVWVVDAKAGTVASRSVELQPAGDASRVTVLSGLNGGELVVTAGVHALRPGQKVRLLEKRP
jgi:multidrug efflux pump subunit AcrA (membrane-fusion protein)